MKFNASTDPRLSEVELTDEQRRVAIDLEWFACSRLGCAREIIALRAALESHAEALRAAKLAGWRAGRKAALDALEPRIEREPYGHAKAAVTLDIEAIEEIAAPTPSQLDEIR